MKMDDIISPLSEIFMQKIFRVKRECNNKVAKQKYTAYLKRGGAMSGNEYESGSSVSRCFACVNNSEEFFQFSAF